MIRRIGLAAICAAMLAVQVGLVSAQAQISRSKAAAVVNGVEISAADLEARVKLMGAMPANFPEAQRRQRYMEALGMLIDEELMHQFLEKNTQPVAPIEVAKHLEELQKGLQVQNKSLEEFCRDTYRNLDQLKAGISEHLRWSAWCAVHISDATVEKYYQDNKDVFDKVYVKASHIVLRVPPSATQEEKVRAQTKLQEIRKKLLSDSKADFAVFAKQYSQDPQATKGGDLGWFPRKWFYDEEFSRAAFALPVGQISDVVQTDFGFHLIKVTERKPGEKSDFSKIKESVRVFCEEETRQQILAQQRKKVPITLGEK